MGCVCEMNIFERLKENEDEKFLISSNCICVHSNYTFIQQTHARFSFNEKCTVKTVVLNFNHLLKVNKIIFFISHP